MNVQIINKQKIYQPIRPEDIKELISIEDENFIIDLIELSINAQSRWHSFESILNGYVLTLARKKNVVVITQNEALNSVLSSIQKNN